MGEGGGGGNLVMLESAKTAEDESAKPDDAREGQRGWRGGDGARGWAKVLLRAAVVPEARRGPLGLDLW